MITHRAGQDQPAELMPSIIWVPKSCFCLPSDMPLLFFARRLEAQHATKNARRERTQTSGFNSGFFATPQHAATNVRAALIESLDLRATGRPLQVITYPQLVHGTGARTAATTTATVHQSLRGYPKPQRSAEPRQSPSHASYRAFWLCRHEAISPASVPFFFSGPLYKFVQMQQVWRDRIWC